MPEKLETVKVVNPDGEGFMIINKDEFDPKTYTLWEKRKREKKAASEESEETENDPLSERLAELESLYQTDGWKAIQALAEPLGIEKPSTGWKAAIALIAQAELNS